MKRVDELLADYQAQYQAQYQAGNKGAYKAQCAKACAAGRLKVSVEAYGYKYTAEGSDEMNLDTLFGRILTPLVLAVGYQPEGVAALFKNGLPTDWDTAYDEDCCE